MGITAYMVCLIGNYFDKKLENEALLKQYVVFNIQGLQAEYFIDMNIHKRLC